MSSGFMTTVVSVSAAQTATLTARASGVSASFASQLATILAQTNSSDLAKL